MATGNPADVKQHYKELNRIIKQEQLGLILCEYNKVLSNCTEAEILNVYSKLMLYFGDKKHDAELSLQKNINDIMVPMSDSTLKSERLGKESKGLVSKIYNKYFDENNCPRGGATVSEIFRIIKDCLGDICDEEVKSSDGKKTFYP